MNKVYLLILGLVFLSSCENKLKTHLEAARIKKASAALVEEEAFAAEKSPYTKLFLSYEAIRKALAEDQLPAIGKLASTLSKEVEMLLKNKKEENQDLVRKVRNAAGALSTEKENEKVRVAFGNLSQAVVALYKKSGSTIFYFYHCPMAKGYQYWLQTKNEDIANPYMGTKMSKCGTKEDSNL